MTNQWIRSASFSQNMETAVRNRALKPRTRNLIIKLLWHCFKCYVSFGYEMYVFDFKPIIWKRMEFN